MSETQGTLELSDYVAAFRRRRALLLALAMPVLAGAFAVAIALPDRYVSTGVIRFTDATVPGELATDAGDRVRGYLDLYVRGLANAVLSPPVLAQLVKQMPQLAQPGRPQKEVFEELADNTSVEVVRADVLDPASGRQRQIIATFTVSYRCADPRTAREVAIWLTNAFLGGSRAGMQMRATAAAQFYDAEVERYRAQIAAIEKKLEGFKERHVGELPELSKLNVTVLDDLQRDLAGVTAQLAQLGMEHRFVLQQLAQQGGAGVDTDLVLQLQAQYERKLSSYRTDHPDMVSLRRQIAGLRSGGAEAAAPSSGRAEQSHTGSPGGHASGAAGGENAATVELKTRLAALEEQMSGLQQREQELRLKTAAFQQRIRATPDTEREYGPLLRDLDLAREKFKELSAYQAKLRVTEAAIATGRSDELRLVRAPDAPARPALPKRGAIAGVGLALALGLALTGAVTREVMDGTVRGSRDVRTVLDMSPLASIPEIVQERPAQRKRRRAAGLAVCVAMGGAVLALILRCLH
jgi:polysaccharide biosynthesis transport protein